MVYDESEEERRLEAVVEGGAKDGKCRRGREEDEGGGNVGDLG